MHVETEAHKAPAAIDAMNVVGKNSQDAAHAYRGSADASWRNAQQPVEEIACKCHACPMKGWHQQPAICYSAAGLNKLAGQDHSAPLAWSCLVIYAAADRRLLLLLLLCHLQQRAKEPCLDPSGA